MKSSLISAAPPKRVISFPCFAKSKVDTGRDMVVLFRNNCQGTIVHSTYPVDAAEEKQIGHYSDKWVPVYDESIWKVLEPGSEIKLIA